MKTPLLLSALFAAITVAAQTSVTVTTGPGNAQQTWYNLNTDASTSAPLAEWDLAFEINGGFNAGIMANTAKGVKVYQAPFPVGDWGTMDTTGMAATWQGLFNSDTDWSKGAFNSDVDLDAYNIGWGIYNTVTHVVAGDSIQVVVLADGSAKMIRIDALGAGTYTFTYANLDGSDEQTHQVAKADYSGKNYAYWSMTAHSAIDREPMSADWDIVFGKYTTDIGMWYGVTGALHNKNVQAVQVGGVPTPDAVFVWNDLGNDINILGYDWKYFDMGTFQYVIEDSLTFFVKDVTGNVWKIWFTAFGGSTTGDISFNKQLISAASVGEVVVNTVVALYPNPTSNGQVNVVMDGFAGTTQLVLSDLNGKVVRQQSANQGGMFGNIVFDVDGVEAGVYMLRVSDGASNTVQRLVVQ